MTRKMDASHGVRQDGVTGVTGKPKTRLATALAECDDRVQGSRTGPLVDICVHGEPDAGLLHMYGHGATKEDVEHAVRAVPGHARSGIVAGP